MNVKSEVLSQKKLEHVPFESTGASEAAECVRTEMKGDHK